MPESNCRHRSSELAAGRETNPLTGLVPIMMDRVEGVDIRPPSSPVTEEYELYY